MRAASFVLLAVVLTAATGAFAERDRGRTTESASGADTLITYQYSASKRSQRELVFETLADASSVELTFDARIYKGTLEARLVDPRGVEVVDGTMGGDGVFRLDTGLLRLVDREPAKDEGVRGRWRLTITTEGRGTYGLRGHGFAAVD